MLLFISARYYCSKGIYIPPKSPHQLRLAPYHRVQSHLSTLRYAQIYDMIVRPCDHTPKISITKIKITNRAKQFKLNKIEII